MHMKETTFPNALFKSQPQKTFTKSLNHNREKLERSSSSVFNGLNEQSRAFNYELRDEMKDGISPHILT